MNTLKEKTVNSLKAGTQNTPSSVKHKFGYKPSALAKENHDTPGVSAKSKCIYSKFILTKPIMSIKFKISSRIFPFVAFKFAFELKYTKRSHDQKHF